MATSANPTPFSEPPWLMGLPSPYYTESHRAWQKTCRAFIDKNLVADAIDYELAGDVPKDLFQKFAAANFLIPNLPAPLPVKWLKKLGVHELPGGLKVEDFDYMHTLIYTDEMARGGTMGASGALTVGFAFGLPPILKYGSQALQERFVPSVITGQKRICIAITEPDAGSDVANIKTTAVKSADGKHYIVSGTKKWITNGIFSDYATMAVRTSGSGAAGLSMLVVPLLNTKGVNMRRLHVGGGRSAGTTYIELDEVQVPVENLIGKEGQGMLYVMQNFNHERLTISISVNRLARTALASAFAYSMKRTAFSKTLIEQPVVRHRLAKSGAQLESHWAWVEGYTWQMTKLNHADANAELGGLTALAKAQAGRILLDCATTATLIFGGNGYTKSGQGAIAEMIWREVPGAMVPGGSEDVMLDLSIRQLLKNWQRKVKLEETKMERPGSKL